MANFEKYLHVERLSSDRCEGLTNGKCYIQPKLDGSNASVWIDKRGKLCAGSRNRELSIEKDNASFYQWLQNVDLDEPIKLRTFLNCNPNLRLYGEWMGSSKFVGNIKDYNEDAIRHFYIFDVQDMNSGCYLTEEEWRLLMKRYNLTEYCVPTLAVIENPTADELIKIAENNHFLLDNANHPGEGIVIKNYNFISKYNTYEVGKIVLDEYIQNKKKNKTAHIPGNVEQEIIELYVTDAELSKTKAKVVAVCSAEEFDDKSNKMIGMFLGYCWNDLLEEAPNWVKKMKNPIVDFLALKGLCATKCRKYLGLM